jgi:hypothetical protein
MVSLWRCFSAQLGDAAAVGAAIAAELRHRLHELALLETRVLDIAINFQVLDYVEGAEHVAVPHKLFQAPQFVRDFRCQIRVIA